MRALALGIALIALTGCYTEPDNPHAAPIAGESVTLHVNNYSGGHLKVRSGGRLVGTADQTRNCVVIPQSFYTGGRLRLSVDPGGGERPFRLPPVDPYVSDGWEVTIEIWTKNRYNQAITLRPAVRCDR